jgi:hypothetical protein
MRFIVLIAIILTAGTAVAGQSGNATDAFGRLQQKEMSGDVILTLDPHILENYNKHLVQNSRNRGIAGYRIRIFSDNGQGAKEHQMRVRANFLSLHPKISTYNRYEGSFYKVYVGDFRTKRDALKALSNIKRNFPDAFIVDDKIVIEE